MAPEPMLPSSTKRFSYDPPSSPLSQLISALPVELNLSTTLLIGATLQSFLFLLLPKVYAITPAIFLLAIRVTDVTLIANGVKANPFLSGVLFNKTTAQVLSSDGTFRGAGQEKVAVLLLGSKSNHPLGLLSPDYKEVGEHFNGMFAELEDPNTYEDTGFLGQTGLLGKDAGGANLNLTISYWRSIEHVHAYAHGPLHRKAWLWWDKTLKQHRHIGLMHEVFEAPKGMWESVYINFQPTMLGATTYLRKDGKLQGGELSKEWVTGLLDANRGLMRTSAGRRGEKGGRADNDESGSNYYVQD